MAAVTILAGQQVNIQVQYTDGDGNPVVPNGVPTWVSGSTNYVTATTLADGTVVASAVGPQGSSVLTATLGTIVKTVTVTVDPVGAVAGTVVIGTPISQQAQAPA